MTSDNSVIIFHRSKQNSEEDLANQLAFLEVNRTILRSTHVIDYVSSNYHEASKIIDIVKNQSNKTTVIFNSFLSEQDYALHYDLYYFFKFLESINMLNIYLMDSKGRLYKEKIEML